MLTYICEDVDTYVHAKCGGQRLICVFFDSPPCLWGQAPSVNPQLTDSASPAGHLAPENTCLCSLSTEAADGLSYLLAFTWVLEIWIQVLILACEFFTNWSNSQSHKSFSNGHYVCTLQKYLTLSHRINSITTDMMESYFIL